MVRYPFLHRRCVALAALAFTSAAPAAAQTPKEKFIADFERMRTNVLAMVDSMPAAGLRTSPTPDVRDFAQQIEHVAIGNVNLIASGVDADRIPLGLEADVYLNDKAELKRLVNVAFDRVNVMLTAMSAEDLAAEGRLFGQIPLPKWQIIQAAHEHGLGPSAPPFRTSASRAARRTRTASCRAAACNLAAIAIRRPRRKGVPL